MSRGQAHPDEQRAAAIKLYLEHKHSARGIANKLGVPYDTVRRWIKTDNPAKLPEVREHYERNAEALGHLVYDTVIETLNAIRARAVATADPDWIRTQDAGALAALDNAQWERIIRVIASFRPAPAAGTIIEGDGAELDVDPVNGAVDATD